MLAKTAHSADEFVRSAEIIWNLALLCVESQPVSVRGGGEGREGEGEDREGQRCGERRQDRGGERVERRGRSGTGKVGRAGEGEGRFFCVHAKVGCSRAGRIN